MRHHVTPGLLLGLLALAGAPVPARPQAAAAPSQQPTFPSRVELVKVDVVVVDKDGQPVSGLTRADFTVAEDGQTQQVETFEAIEAPKEVEAAPAPERLRVSTNREEARAHGRTFVVVFDDLNMTTLRTTAARAAVAELLRQGVREGDRVLLTATGGGAWWSARMLAGRDEILAQLDHLVGRRRVDTDPDRVTDWEALRIHVFRDREVSARVQRRFKEMGVTPESDVQREEYRFNFEDPYLLQRASQVYLQSLQRNRATLGLLRRALVALAPVPGRKSAILVSEGFVHDPTLPEFKQTVESARRANVTLYFLDARGLTGAPLMSTAEFNHMLIPEDVSAMALDDTLASQGSEYLADETGGFTVKNTNDLASGIERIARESETYYMLGYRPPASPSDGRFHKIEVKVRRGGVKVRARRGYYALEEGEAESASPSGRPDFQPALDSPFALGDIPLRMTALVFGEQDKGKAEVLVATEVDVKDFAFEKVADQLKDELQVLLVVAHRDTGEFSRYDQSIELTFPAQALKTVAESGYIVARPFPLPSGGYQAKIAVRDRNGGRIGTVLHDFEVPDLAGFRTSTPLVTDTVQGAPGTRPRPVLRLSRLFTPESTLYCEYEVYEAALDARTGMPQVRAGYEIRRQDGTVVSRVDPTAMRPTSIGKLSRLVAAPLWGFPPGEYDLVLLVEDQIAGRKIEVKEPFRVARPS